MRQTLVSEGARQELFNIAAAVKTRTYSKWAELFEPTDAPYAKACTTEEVFEPLREDERFATPRSRAP